jgi:hypothetical protein
MQPLEAEVAEVVAHGEGAVEEAEAGAEGVAQEEAWQERTRRWENLSAVLRP